jgi:hypothetical protein
LSYVYDLPVPEVLRDHHLANASLERLEVESGRVQHCSLAGERINLLYWQIERGLSTGCARDEPLYGGAIFRLDLREIYHDIPQTRNTIARPVPDGFSD